MDLRNLLALGLCCTGVAAQAASLVTGDVSFNASSRLYTYTYVIDTDELPAGGFREFGILSNSTPSFYAPLPVANAQPQGWNFALSVGGWTQASVDVHGSFWMWSSTAYDVSPGGLLTYSFSTPHAPDTGTSNNFFVYSGVAAGPENLPIAYGRIVGPDLTVAFVEPAVVPEPASWLLWPLGLLTLACAQRRRVLPLAAWRTNAESWREQRAEEGLTGFRM